MISPRPASLAIVGAVRDAGRSPVSRPLGIQAANPDESPAASGAMPPAVAVLISLRDVLRAPSPTLTRLAVALSAACARPVNVRAIVAHRGEEEIT